jgi:hypothetical protein
MLEGSDGWPHAFARCWRSVGYFRDLGQVLGSPAFRKKREKAGPPAGFAVFIEGTRQLWSVSKVDMISAL